MLLSVKVNVLGKKYTFFKVLEKYLSCEKLNGFQNMKNDVNQKLRNI